MSFSTTPPPSRMPGMGLRPDRPDRRDRALYAAVPNIDALPDRADLTHLLPPGHDKPPGIDQRWSSACVGYSGASTLYGVMKKDGHRRPFVASPVFLYREARVLGGYLEEDAGAEIRLMWKAANKLGLPPQSNLKPRFLPEDMADPSTAMLPENSIWRRQPPPSVYADAERRQVLTYFRMSTLNDVLQSLADGWPVQFGFMMNRSAYGPGGPL